MIIITGAAGFIGSALLSYFNANHPDVHIVIVDNFSVAKKRKNYQQKRYLSCVERKSFFGFLDENHHKIDFIFHLGARTDTTETDEGIFEALNLQYSKKIWKACSQYKIPLIYASSAATYGDGSLGYRDIHELATELEPLNPYGLSKNEFDKWILNQDEKPPFWSGLKFFNVYGPNEYHKGRMASVVFHAFKQIRNDNSMKLFRSHNPDFEDGQQLRDFIYIKDILSALDFLYQNHHQVESGIFNLGTGTARSFEDLVLAVFDAMDIKPNIEYIDMPEDIRENYQYYTCADMTRFQSLGYQKPMLTLEKGVEDYVKNYLFEKNYL